MKQGQRGDLIIGGVLMLVLLAALVGCGKKDDPMPPDIKLPEAVQKLTVQKAGPYIRLSWELPGDSQSLKDIKIERSELETLRGDCPECPRNYKQLAAFLTNDPLLLQGGRGIYRYDDTQVKTGWLYTYRIIVCNYKGYCSEPSEPAELKF